MNNHRILIKEFFIPLFLLCIIALLTVVLFNLRFIVSSVVQNNNLEGEIGEKEILPLRGIGKSKPVAFNMSEFVTYYGGGQGSDSIVAITDSSLRITTGGDGGWYGARAKITPTDVSSSTITFSVRFDQWDDVDRVLVMFASDNGEFQNYFGLNLKNKFAFPADDEWISIMAEKSEFEVIAGNPNWDHVTDIAVRVVPKPAVATRVWFDAFGHIPKKASSTIVSITFDDGFKSVLDAMEVMDTYGMDGTAYVIPDYLNKDGYLNKNDLDLLSEKGWDISGHGSKNLIKLEYSDTDTELAEMFTFLETNKYTGMQHFAYPNGGYDEEHRSQIQEYFQTGRTIDGFVQTQDYMIPTAISAFTVSSDVSKDELFKKIDDAILENSWLILVWHDLVNEEPQIDVEYKLEDFQKIMQYLSDKNVEVLPFSEAYNKIRQ